MEKSINLIKNFVISAITYSDGSDEAFISPCNVVEDHIATASDLEYFNYPACAEKLQVPLKELYAVCGEDDGWRAFIADLLSEAEVIKVFERGSDGFTTSSALLFSYHGYHFILNIVDGVPAITGSKQFFDFIVC